MCFSPDRNLITVYEAYLWDKLSWNVTQKKKGYQGFEFALGYWLVRRYVISEDGEVDVGVAQFIKWSIRIVAVTCIFLVVNENDFRRPSKSYNSNTDKHTKSSRSSKSAPDYHHLV
ncbi:hypothetical protein L6452_12796 [Arctium lappa]|uniref:Uncharacterized protein n=1 Tax=Arctium lappa TaxID=4217 RepID=A0ACB9CGS0_ARCLA|nr:hypothetical protein L6452_12796 [Arctium lappa]